MALDSLEIANNALVLVGTRRITALSDPSKEARNCNDQYDLCRRAVLRMHPWNFAVKRVVLEGVEVSAIADDGSGLIEVTATAHGLVTGDRATVSGVIGTVEANMTGEVTRIDANTFTFDDSEFENAYVSGGTVTKAAEFQYDHSFALPADFIRVHTVYDDGEFPLRDGEYNVEGARLLTVHDTLKLKYVYDIEDTTQFDPIFDEALAAYLATKIVYKLTGSNARNQELQDALESAMRKARFVDSVEDPSPKVDADEWLRARVGVNSGFVRDPMT